MTQQAPAVVVHGIDFGTSTSMITIGRPGMPQLLVRDPAAVYGEVGIPTSVCARFDGTLAVGFEAERIKQIHVADYRTGFKIDIGKRGIHRLGGIDYSSADLMAEVIRFLRDRALAMVPAEPDIVLLTVPVAWEGYTRDQAIRACTVAGYQLARVRLETEPVAALAGLGTLTGTTVIYDLGGGTFDCAIARQTGKGPQIWGPPGGLRRVGGRFFDDRIVRLVRDRFPQADKIFAAEDAVPGEPASTGGPPGAASAAIDSLRRRIQLREKCVEAKVELSLIQFTEKLLSELSPPELLRLSQQELNAAIGDLVEETVGECERLLTAVGLSFSDVDQVLQIGGSSRIPLSAQRLRARSKRPVTLAEEPDLAVVRGATELALQIALSLPLESQAERQAEPQAEPELVPEPGAEPGPGAARPSADMPSGATPADEGPADEGPADEGPGLGESHITKNFFKDRSPGTAWN
jgi:molecular chaperone DnaK (HSP70)